MENKIPEPPKPPVTAPLDSIHDVGGGALAAGGLLFVIAILIWIALGL